MRAGLEMTVELRFAWWVKPLVAVCALLARLHVFRAIDRLLPWVYRGTSYRVGTGQSAGPWRLLSGPVS